MAIFTVMLSILIKGFQMASDISQKQSSTINQNEVALVTLNLLSQDLDKVDHGQLENYYKASTNEYSSFNKSSHFYINIDNNDIRFFTSSDDETKITAIQYKFTNTEGLVRYEKSFTKTIQASDYKNDSNSTPSSGESINVANTLNNARDNKFDLYPFKYLGIDDKGTESTGDDVLLFPPNLAVEYGDDSSETPDGLTGIDKSILIPGTNSSNSDNTNIVEDSFTLGVISYDPNSSNGFSLDPNAYKNGDLPESIQVNFALNVSNDPLLNKNFSRSIPVSNNDFFGKDI